MGEITLQHALDEFKEVFMPARNYAERTRIEYSNDMQDLVDYLAGVGITKVGEIGLPNLEQYLALLDSRGYSAPARKRKTATIRLFFSFLKVEGYVADNITRRLIPPQFEYKNPFVLTEAEYNRLRQACAGNPRDAAIVELLLQTGIRLSELTRLTLNDVELPLHAGQDPDISGTLRIFGAGRRKDRTLPLNSKACAALNTYLAIRPEASNLALFLNKFEDPLGARGVQKLLKKYFLKAGIVRAHVHSLRHTFGTHHAAKGTSLKTIQETMGHKDQRSTSMYVTLAGMILKREIQDHSL